MRNRTSILLTAVAIPALLLTGCVGQQLPIDPPDTGVPGGSGNGPVTGMPAVDDEFFDLVDSYKTDLDEWRDNWLAMSCTPEIVATGEMNCALHLTAGGLLGTAIQIVFASTGVADFDLHTQLADLGGAQDVALATYVAAEEWSDENCAGANDPTCLPYAEALAGGLLDLHAELLTWSR